MSAASPMLSKVKQAIIARAFWSSAVEHRDYSLYQCAHHRGGTAMQAMYLVRTGEAGQAFERRDAPTPEPAAGQLRVAVEAFGLNYADVVARHGLYQDAPPLPSVIGY